MCDWLDVRTGYRALLTDLLDEPIPSGAGWWFVTGSIVLFLLTVQLVTGVVLAFFYSPSPDYAYDSVRFIMERLTLLLPFLDRRPERNLMKRPLVAGGFIVTFVGITVLTILGFRSTPDASSAAATDSGAPRPTQLGR